ncbi:MAG: hypothetical protein H0Z38_07200 [Firmicutes bacterium]|nr:hypothetical protein [Bacillota bacterium]
MVETTPRYVRTILSEAGISLTDLRRSYARKMEKRLGINVTVPKHREGLTDVLIQAGNRVNGAGIAVYKVVDAEAAKLLGVSPKEPLLKIVRGRVVNGKPFYVTEVITHLNLVVNEAALQGEAPLRIILGLEKESTVFRERSFQVTKADPMVAAILGIEPGSPVIRAGNVIETDGVVVGLEYNIFEAFRVKFVFRDDADYKLQLIEVE